MDSEQYRSAHRPTSEFQEFINGVKTQVAHHPGFSTKCVHAGQEPEPVHGSVNVPIHLTSTYAQRGPTELYSKFDYTRCGNPTLDHLCQSIAALEYAQYAQVFSSGCGATVCINALLSSGDHIVCCDDVYGGTNRQLNKVLVPQFGIQVDFVDMTILDEVLKAIKPNTKLVWIETPTNPTLKVADIQAIAQATKKVREDIVVVVDNTFCSPYLQSPLLLGADISYNSMTKYLGGHSDVVAGCMATNRKDLFDRVSFNCKSRLSLPSFRHESRRFRRLHAASRHQDAQGEDGGHPEERHDHCKVSGDPPQRREGHLPRSREPPSARSCQEANARNV